MRTSISDKDDFKTVCKEACVNDEKFDEFKKNKVFQFVLEHVSEEYGTEYMKSIINNDNLNYDYINKFKENDEQGGSDIVHYPDPFGKISPSTLRYVKVLSDLVNHFGDLSNMNIVEIGVGYGGQSKIIMDYFDIREYNFVDLEEVNCLAKRYLNKYDYTNLNFLDFNNLPDKEYDLVISNYSFTELKKEIQDLYLNKIINKSKKVYMLGNDISERFGVSSYSKEEIFNRITDSEEYDEVPSTFEGNYLLIKK